MSQELPPIPPKHFPKTPPNLPDTFQTTFQQHASTSPKPDKDMRLYANDIEFLYSLNSWSQLRVPHNSSRRVSVWRTPDPLHDSCRCWLFSETNIRFHVWTWHVCVLYGKITLIFNLIKCVLFHARRPIFKGVSLCVGLFVYKTKLCANDFQRKQNKAMFSFHNIWANTQWNHCVLNIFEQTHSKTNCVSQWLSAETVKPMAFQHFWAKTCWTPMVAHHCWASTKQN